MGNRLLIIGGQQTPLSYIIARLSLASVRHLVKRIKKKFLASHFQIYYLVASRIIKKLRNKKHSIFLRTKLLTKIRIQFGRVLRLFFHCYSHHGTFYLRHFDGRIMHDRRRSLCSSWQKRYQKTESSSNGSEAVGG